ncbi:hypothetical protein ACFYP4_02375 [Streptomyces sp. NPDC005551]|uniref:hypothetical protein n=1 Tax=Streptomyces sp. NPDC005551 TaxID=3364725 RepID=UPI0036CCD62C
MKLKDIPTEFDGGPVLAHIHVPSALTEAPHQAVIMYDRGADTDPKRRFAVVGLKAKSLDETWQPIDDGLYDKTWEQATELFASRVMTRNERRTWID